MYPSEKKNRRELVAALRSLADEIEDPSTEIDGEVSIRNNNDSQRKLGPFGSATVIRQSVTINFDIVKYDVNVV